MLNKIKESFLNGKEVLITGGTGSLGKTITKLLLAEYGTKGIRIYSRDEAKQSAFAAELKNSQLSGEVAFLIGDVRNIDRLNRAMNGVDVVIHTAAQKQVPSCEYNPIEAVQTNIIGAQNVINAAIDNKVKRVMNIATDKGVYPINLYGCTKAVAEKLFIHSNIYSPHGTRFACCRYGNVMGSTGSVIPLFRKQAKESGVITVTDKDMTRFWITLDRVTKFVLSRITTMEGGEIFVPFMKAMSMERLAALIAPEAEIQIIGSREGEKLHECIISREELERTTIHSETEQAGQYSLYYSIKRTLLPLDARVLTREYTSLYALEYEEQEMLKMLE